MKYFLRLWLFIAVLSHAAFAYNVQLLTDHIGSSASTIAIGNIEGMYTGSFSIFENAAGLMNTNYYMSTLHTQLPDSDTRFTCISASIPLLSGQFGVGMIGINSHSLDKTVNSAFNIIDSEQTFSVFDRVYVAGYQRFLMPQLSGGISLKFVDQDLYTDRGTGMNADVGVIYNAQPFRFSGSLKNILRGNKVLYSKSDAALSFPFQAALSARYDIDAFGLMGQVRYHDEGSLFLKALGMDYRLAPHHLTFYAGWKEVPVSRQIKNTLSVGSRLELHAFAVSISYELSEFIEQDSRYYLSFEMKL